MTRVPSFGAHASGTDGWLWNPGGDALFDRASADLSPRVARIDEHAAALVGFRDARGRECRALGP